VAAGVVVASVAVGVDDGVSDAAVGVSVVNVFDTATVLVMVFVATGVIVSESGVLAIMVLVSASVGEIASVAFTSGAGGMSVGVSLALTVAATVSLGSGVTVSLALANGVGDWSGTGRMLVSKGGFCPHATRQSRRRVKTTDEG
jgi:hypothetical protein